MDSVLFGRSILFFTVEFRPYGSRGSDANFQCHLVYFSAFERLELRSETESPMQKKANITMLYEPGPADLNSSSKSASTKLPILHVGYAQHILCRAPLIPAFLDGSATNTIPITKREEAQSFPYGKTDSRAGAGDGSRVYEVNMPLWRFGRGKAREVSVDEAERLRDERIAASRRQAAQTKKNDKRRRAEED